MKLLAISDAYLPDDVMFTGLAELPSLGVDIEVRPWKHASLVELQQANLAIEQHGPEAVPLPGELVRDVDQFHIVLVQFAPLSAAVIESAKQLKLIGVLRTGTENVDVAVATRRGVSVVNTPGRNARAVAECTIGLMLAETRNIARAHAAMHQGLWRRSFPNSDAIPELHGKTIGLVGYGAVGRLVAGFLHAFGSRILAFDPYCRDDASPAELVSLSELLRQSDIVSLHARLTEETKHLIGAAELGLMKRTAVLVNTARSGLIDETALVEALRSGKIMGAALDVFDREPLPENHPLRELDNVTLTPHLAGSTIDAFYHSAKLMADQLVGILRGGSARSVVNGIEPDLG